MRLILGMILGAALTIERRLHLRHGDYASPGTEARPMVELGCGVSRNTDSVVTMIKQGWAKLTS